MKEREKERKEKKEEERRSEKLHILSRFYGDRVVGFVGTIGKVHLRDKRFT